MIIGVGGVENGLDAYEKIRAVSHSMTFEIGRKDTSCACANGAIGLLAAHCSGCEFSPNIFVLCVWRSLYCSLDQARFESTSSA